MAQKSIRLSRPAMVVHSVSMAEDRWVIEAETHSMPRCPSCGTPSGRQHSWYRRTLRDLPMQGIPVIIRLRVRKWRCQAPTYDRSIFAERLPGLASPRAHQTDAIADILAVMGHGAGGETSRRLLARLGIVVSGDTVLRHLKRRAQRVIIVMTALGEHADHRLAPPNQFVKFRIMVRAKCVPYHLTRDTSCAKTGCD